MGIEKICTPALIYLFFALSQVIIDTFKKAYNVAFVKFIQMVVFTLLLNLLCMRGLTWVSWLIIAIPFLFMGFMTFFLLYIFNLDNQKTVVLDDDDDNDSDSDSDSGNDDNSETDQINNYWYPPQKYSISSGEFVS